MLWTVFLILLILWLLGFISGTTLSGFVHLLLLAALVVLVIRLVQGPPWASWRERNRIERLLRGEIRCLTCNT